MLYGVMAGDRVLLVADESEGRPVTEAAAPAVPDGYEARARFEDAGASIAQVWDVVPREGTAAEAALALAQMQAASLSDDDALKVPALYPRWAAAHSYAEGDRFTHAGKLWKALKAHLSASNAAPGQAPTALRRGAPHGRRGGQGVGERQVLRKGRPRHQVRQRLRVPDGRQHARARHVRQRVRLEAADGLGEAREWKNSPARQSNGPFPSSSRR